ncbi:hypothetical protein RMR16_000790 [Agrobacterium sp. rho-13.3]|uniref:hypothetical protein n=1 Tax=Agrobacterium sp. rho-13.3 TaxID=3072980 RepID=UPI002A0DEBBF|nr:hypothetical protein [Agrobacterium sp. rho-13.3]MDX8310535.1 hypothetical protein [Agrobacterium sp. rho-13.3]
MQASVRSHGFAKPSDLENELSELEDDVKKTVKTPVARAKAAATKATTVKAPAKTTVDPALRKEVDDLRKQVETIRKQVEKLQAAQIRKPQSQPQAQRPSKASSQHADMANWLPVIRSVAITSLAGRIFASSPIMALLVAAVPFALGLSAGSKN